MFFLYSGMLKLKACGHKTAFGLTFFQKNGIFDLFQIDQRWVWDSPVYVDHLLLWWGLGTKASCEGIWYNNRNCCTSWKENWKDRKDFRIGKDTNHMIKQNINKFYNLCQKCQLKNHFSNVKEFLCDNHSCNIFHI